MKFKHAALIVFAVVGLGSQAMADSCKKPTIKVVNDRSSTIKVKKIQYFDDCQKKWRDEGVSDIEIPPGSNRSFTDNLEYVEGCKVTKFKLYRAVRQSSGSAYGSYEWGGELTPDEGAKTCTTGTVYTIHAHE